MQVAHSGVRWEVGQLENAGLLEGTLKKYSGCLEESVMPYNNNNNNNNNKIGHPRNSDSTLGCLGEPFLREDHFPI